MNAVNMVTFSRMGAALLSVALGSVLGQVTPPAELILKGKVRDFIEDNPTRTPIHPHFYGTRPHQAGCSSQGAGVNIVQVDIDTANALGDTAVFKGDNRGPKLVTPLDPRVAQCFDPVSRFGEWYNDKTTGDVNRSFLIDIKFVRNAALGVYEYFDDNFFPIDNGKTYTTLGANAPYGHLLTGANAIHNYGFTMEFHANFTYFKGSNQTFSFRGDDDVWVFINGKRVIDLGGIHEAQDATVNLDLVAASIGLQDSLVYPLDFFFAERHVTTSKLRITTTLELEPLLGKPTLTPGGFFEGQTLVTATHSSPDAILYYTTDGSTPTTSSQRYTGPISLSATTTLKVLATRPGWRNSEVVTETYTRMETVAAPAANPTGRIFVDPIQVALTVSTPGAAIRYTLDGSTPDSTSPLYSGPLTFAATTTLKAKAFLTNWVSSAVMIEIYTDASTLVPPVADPAGRIFVGTQAVSLMVPGHADAVIRYTTDGTEPNVTSPIYTTPLTFTTNTTLKAKAFKPDWKPSQVMTEVYTEASTLVPPVANPVGGGFVGSQTVSLMVPGHADAVIRFTTDGSEPTATSPVYTTPLTFTANTTLKAKAFKTDWKPSQAMVEVYARLSAAVNAVYVDFDGNGNIDGAIIRLDVPSGVPSSVRLVDPFSKAPLVLESSHITKGASEDILIVRFPDKQFTPGTTFPPGEFGSFPNVPGYGSLPFTVSDSVGPVPIKAVSRNKATPEDKPWVDITFSEPVNLAEIQAGNLWPFDIIRGGGPQGGQVLVSSVTPVDGQPNTYRWTFEVGSPAFPVYIDSLVLASKPTIHDPQGSPSVGGGKRIPVEGVPQILNNTLLIHVTNPVVAQQNVTFQNLNLEIRQNPFAVVGTTPVGAEICLSCSPGTGSVFTPNYPLPEWVIKSKYAFNYSFVIFDHIGNYVSRTEGKVTEAMLAQAAQDKDGFRALKFRWLPVARNGATVGTGAYILKGVVVNHENEEQKGSQGENQLLRQAQTAVFATFGYLRQN